MDTRMLDWNWRGQTIRLGADARGTGPKVLLLPALSSISSRREMHALQERLAPRYSTLAVDWPGFGEGARPQVDWTPEAYAAFLAFLQTSVIAHPHAISAGGDDTARSDRADLARTIAHHDGRAAAVLRTALPPRRSSPSRSAHLSLERQPVHGA